MIKYLKSLYNPSSFPSTVYGFGLILFLAAVLYYQHAWVPGYFHDGHLYAAFGKNAALKGYWWETYLAEKNYATYAQHPPLIFILEGLYFKVAGASWVQARLFHTTWAVMAICILTFLIRRYGSLSWSYFGGFLLTIFPPLFKKARSPNLDVPLMTLILLSLTCYFQAQASNDSKKRKNVFYLLTGIFFGLALLVKGPPALCIPLTIFLHLIFTKKLSELKNVVPWLSLILGLMIFSIWPLVMHLKGHFPNIIDYARGQILGTIIKGRGREELNLFTYPYYLLQNAPLQFILSFFGVYFVIKEGRKNPLGLLFLSLLISILLPFSFVKWKYSNYIVPAFPALAAIGAIPLAKLSFTFHKHFSFIVSKLSLVLALILLIFPLTTKSTRDYDIFKIFEIIDHLPQKPSQFRVVGHIYPYHNLVNLIGWEGRGEVSSLKMENLYTVSKKSIILVSLSECKKVEREDPKRFAHQFIKFIFFPERDMMVLLTKDFILSPLESNGIFVITRN